MKTLNRIAHFILLITILVTYIGFGSGLIATVFAVTFTAGQFILLHVLVALVISIIKIFNP